MNRPVLYIAIITLFLAASGLLLAGGERVITRPQVATATNAPVSEKTNTRFSELSSRQEYIDEFKSVMLEWLNGYSKFERALPNFKNDILFTKDANWHLEIKNNLIEMTTAAEKMESLPPPPLELKELNQNLLGIAQSTKNLEESWILMTSNPGDPTYSDGISGAINDINLYFNLIVEELENISS